MIGKAVGNYLVVKIDTEPEKVRGLYMGLPDKDIIFRKGEVISVGGNVVFCKEGDIIHFNKNLGHDIILGKDKYRIISREQVVIVE